MNILKFYVEQTYLEWNSNAVGGLGGKPSLFSDISLNSTLEKQTLHKIQYEENGFFTKFNSVHVYIFTEGTASTPRPFF